MFEQKGDAGRDRAGHGEGESDDHPGDRNQSDGQALNTVHEPDLHIASFDRPPRSDKRNGGAAHGRRTDWPVTAPTWRESAGRTDCPPARLRAPPTHAGRCGGVAGDGGGPRATAAGQRDEFAAAISDAAAWVLAVTVLLQIIALLARSEAWHLTIQAAGGTVDRRVLYRASSMQVLGSVLNTQLGVAARIAALRRSSPQVSPQVPTLIAAEFPILAVEAMLAALASFTLVEPLGLPWWLPLAFLAVIGTASAGLRHLAVRKGRELWSGLAVLAASMPEAA